MLNDDVEGGGRRGCRSRSRSRCKRRRRCRWTSSERRGLAASRWSVGAGPRGRRAKEGFTGDSPSRAWGGSQGRRENGASSCSTHHLHQRRMRVAGFLAGSDGRGLARRLPAIWPRRPTKPGYERPNINPAKRSLGQNADAAAWRAIGSCPQHGLNSSVPPPGGLPSLNTRKNTPYTCAMRSLRL
jgi:hypothetical protein